MSVDSIEIHVPQHTQQTTADRLQRLALPQPKGGDRLRISFINNEKPNTTRLFELVEEKLGVVYDVESRHYTKGGAGLPAPAEVLDRAAKDTDLAILATGDCGSCTSWCINDTVEMLKRGIPAVAVTTEVFVTLAEFESKAWGWDVPIAAMNHPFGGVPADKLEIHAEQVASNILGRIATGEVSDADEVVAAAELAMVGAPAEPWAFFDFIQSKGWGDGLPVFAPTPARVAQMLDANGVDPDMPIGQIAPARRLATAEGVAANAVLAGCVDEAFPVVLAAVRAALQDPFNLLGILATTHPCGTAVIVSGPVAEQLGMNAGASALGAGNRANLTIGRAVRLSLQNLGQAWPGTVDKSQHGQPGKLAYCFAENLDASPWLPHHVERGFAPDESTVTVVAAEGPRNMHDPASSTPENLIRFFIGSMTCAGHNNLYHKGDLILVLGPEHAQLFADAGWDRDRIRQTIFDRALLAPAEMGREAFEHFVSRWPGQPVVSFEDDLLEIVRTPEDIKIIVSGGPGKHSVWLPTFGQSFSTIEAVRPS